MSEQTPVTTREAVLASLLGHACIIILVLLFPDAFKWNGHSLFTSSDPNAPIPLEFLRQPTAVPPPSAALGDAGHLKSSDPRRPDAPRPTNEDPYSIGNTRNRFVAPPMPQRAPPSPNPGAAGPTEPSPQQSLAQGSSEDQENAARSGEQTPADASVTSPLQVPPHGQRGFDPKGAKGSSLKEALGRMSVGMSGGPPLKFDNPTGGLSGPLGGLSFDTPGFDWGPYSRKIYWISWTNWTRGWPPAAWAGLKGIVTVHFTIWKNGKISDITILDASGTPAFDSCATVALEASSPLPALPSDFPKESEGITARFLYNTDADEQ
jgi:TonB family protein